MVDVAHDGDDSRSWLQETRIILCRDILGRIRRSFCFDQGDAEFFCQDLDGVAVQVLVDGRHDAVHHERFDDLADFTSEKLSQLLDGNARRQLTSVGYAATFFSFVCFFFLLWLKERAMREPPSFSLRLLSQSFFVFFLAGFSALLVTGFCAVSSTGALAAAAGRCGRAGRSVFGRSPFLSFLKRSFLPLPPLCPFLAPCGRSPLRPKRSFL